MKAKIIESNIARCNRLTELVDDGVMVINGDGRDMQLLMEEGIKNTEAFVALTGNSETNILACLAAKRMGVTKTVAEVENVDYISDSGRSGECGLHQYGRKSGYWYGN